MEALFPLKVWGTREITLTRSELSELAAMQAYFLANEPISFLPLPQVDATIFSDACATGWGGLLVWPDGRQETVAGRWPEADIAGGVYDSSTVSEPLGLIKVWRAWEDRGSRPHLVGPRAPSLGMHKQAATFVAL